MGAKSCQVASSLTPALAGTTRRAFGVEPTHNVLVHWTVTRSHLALIRKDDYREEVEGKAVLFIEQLPEAARTVRQVLQPEPRDQPGAVAKVQQAAQELEKAATDAAAPNGAPPGVTSGRTEEPTFKWSDYLWQGSRGVLEFAGQLSVMLCLVYLPFREILPTTRTNRLLPAANG